MSMFNVKLDLNTLKAKKTAEINARKTHEGVRGLPYYFNGERDFIQLRDERDRGNITALVTQALILQGQGVSDPVIPFMPESNTLRMLTPTEVIDMGKAVVEFGSRCYSTAWTLKAQVEAATTVAEVQAIKWPEDEF